MGGLIWPSMSLKFKSADTFGLLCVFLLVFNSSSSIHPKLYPFLQQTFWNISELERDLCKSLKLKFHGVFWIQTHDFLLVINSSMYPSSLLAGTEGSEIRVTFNLAL